MAGHSRPPSPEQVIVQSTSGNNWETILHSSNQLVLYNPTSHALSVTQSNKDIAQACPYCRQPLPEDFEPPIAIEEGSVASDEYDEISPPIHSRAPNYFQLLEVANETNASQPSTSGPHIIGNGDSTQEPSVFPEEAMAHGYFKAFFKEEARLGMGANGTVYLCQHVLDGNPLGHFAVKKIAVGESHSYLLKILREVRLLESLHHPNIITYHHSWLEVAQFSAFGPRIPTLHVLMQWAEGGSLDDFIDVRLGRRAANPLHLNPLAHFNPASSDTSPANPSSKPLSMDHNEQQPAHPSSGDLHSRSARIRAFRALQRASPEERERLSKEPGQGQRTWTAVHLFSAEELRSLFGDVVEGLAFLHDRSILHLDLKPGNVLLTWDEGRLIPRAMLSDFGTSRDMMRNERSRSGNTGTLEYTSPESLPSPTTGLLRTIDSKSDMWSLGMILHKMLFFHLPYRYATDSDPESVARDEDLKMEKLEQEVLNYPGFRPTTTLATACEARRIPKAVLLLLETLLNITPTSRPTCERVAHAIREGRLDPSRREDRSPNLSGRNTALVPVLKPPSPGIMNLNGTQMTGEGSTKASKPNLSGDQASNLSRQRLVPTAGRTIPGQTLIRIAKACLLISKVLSAASYCRPSIMAEGVFYLLLALATVDVCFIDDLRMSFVLGAAHLAVVQVFCEWLGYCCVPIRD